MRRNISRDALVVASRAILNIANAADVRWEEMPRVKIVFDNPDGYHRFVATVQADPFLHKQPNMPPDTWLIAGLMVSIERNF